MIRVNTEKYGEIKVFFRYEKKYRGHGKKLVKAITKCFIRVPNAAHSYNNFLPEYKTYDGEAHCNLKMDNFTKWFGRPLALLNAIENFQGLDKKTANEILHAYTSSVVSHEPDKNVKPMKFSAVAAQPEFSAKGLNIQGLNIQDICTCPDCTEWRNERF